MVAGPARPASSSGGAHTSFAETIRNRRLELGRTQREVACAVGIASPDFIGLVESGKRRLDLDRVPALAKVLEVDPGPLCRQALAERAPRLAAQLFGTEAVPDEQRPCVGGRARAERAYKKVEAAERRALLLKEGRRRYRELRDSCAVEKLLSVGAPELWLPEVAAIEQQMTMLERAFAAIGESL